MMIPIAKPIIEEDERAAILEVLESGQLVQGPKVKAFEEAFASKFDVPYAIAISSGTAALHIAMLAHGIGPGDEVLTTPFSFVASANAALFVGAKPVFCDIEPDYYTIDPREIEVRITPHTKAIVVVHLYGQACDVDTISQIAQEHGLILIEDAAQAHGATLNDLPVGSWGTACYSLYPTKNMTTIEGGMITTHDPKIADRARMLRNHGSRERYVHESLGYNLRMTDIQAAIGLVQLSKLDGWNKQRRANAEFLTEHLSQLPGIRIPQVRPNATHVFHQYTIRIETRDVVAEQLREQGIGFGIHYPIPLYAQPLYRELGYAATLQETEAACREVLSLPVHPALSREDLQQIVSVVSSLEGIPLSL